MGRRNGQEELHVGLASFPSNARGKRCQVQTPHATTSEATLVRETELATLRRCPLRRTNRPDLLRELELSVEAKTGAVNLPGHTDMLRKIGRHETIQAAVGDEPDRVGRGRQVQSTPK